jgi:HAD superfamily hydrolase (TIGR01509 family)
MVKAVLFDLGDTLIHGNFTTGETDHIWEEVYGCLINPNNNVSLPTLAVLRRSIEANVGRAMAHTWKYKTEKELDVLELFRAAFNEAGFELDDEDSYLRDVIALEHRLLYQRVVQVGPGVLNTLEELKRQGLLVGLVSNFCNLPEVVTENLTQIGLLHHFDRVAISCEVGWRKPSSHIYAAICERLEVAPEECLFVGDRLIEDIRGPHAFGMRAILSHEFRQEEPTEEIRPDGVITRIEQTFEYL